VSRLGFGCGGLSGILNAPLSHQDGCSVIKEDFSNGITFFDAADVYGKNHENEIMVCKALNQLPRDQIQLATEFSTVVLVRYCCESSLKWLDVDYNDLYYQHLVDTSVPIEETMEELKKLVEEGKIKYIVLSEASAVTIKRAHAIHPITALQMEYSLWTRKIEDEIIPNIKDNVGPLALKLTQEHLKEIRDAVPIDDVSGTREVASYAWKFADTPIKET
ncbi:hypothetical protein ES288_A01G027600v1, partial [Gossypium darwinii]